MFKNRSFLVKVVKDKDSDTNVEVENDGVISEVIAGSVISKAIATDAVRVILVYLTADTCRQILIHLAKTRIK